eukprot:4051813-Ditylum_brightwellii.AAC.1
MDANVVREHVSRYYKNDPSFCAKTGNNGAGGHDVIIEDSFGRVSCKMSFDSETFNLLHGEQENQQSDDKNDNYNDNDPFSWDKSLGIRYEMILTEYSNNGSNDNDDNQGYNFVEAPEWVVPMTTLVDIARAYGDLHLVPEESCNFHDFYHLKKRKDEYKFLLRRMKVLQDDGYEDDDNVFSRIEWDLAHLYRTLVFRKGKRQQS